MIHIKLIIDMIIDRVLVRVRMPYVLHGVI